MKKEEIRKEFFKLKIKGHSYNQCRKILFIKYNFEVTNRTLKDGCMNQIQIMVGI